MNRALLERLKTLEDRRASKDAPKSAKDDRKQKLLDEFREDVERQGRPRSAGTHQAQKQPEVAEKATPQQAGTPKGHKLRSNASTSFLAWNEEQNAASAKGKVLDSPSNVGAGNG